LKIDAFLRFRLKKHLFTSYLNITRYTTIFRYHKKYLINDHGRVHYFLKQRALFYKGELLLRGTELAETYQIQNLSFNKDDLVIDVEANNGDLLLFLNLEVIEYIGFEPSSIEFSLLQLNIDHFARIYPYVVGDIDREVNFLFPRTEPIQVSLSH
jgi:hypothetical protein